MAEIAVLQFQRILRIRRGQCCFSREAAGHIQNLFKTKAKGVKQ